MAHVIDLDEESLSPPAPSREASPRGHAQANGGNVKASPPSSAGSSKKQGATTTAAAARGKPSETAATVEPIDVDLEDDDEDAERVEKATAPTVRRTSASPGGEGDGMESGGSSEDGRESEDESKTRLDDPAQPEPAGSIGSGSASAVEDVKSGKNSKPASSSSKLGAAATATTSAAPASTKPKSTRKRSPSPSPPPQVIRPPVKTIRLEIRLGGPDNYAVDVTSLAKSTGQLPASPPPPAHLVLRNDNDASESEANDDTDAGKGKKKGKGGRKKNLTTEEYDLQDPFIDDSELAIDQRKTFAQTKQQGFYVSSGEVALVKDKSSPQKKPKSKKIIPTIIPLAGSSTLSAAATKAPNSTTTATVNGDPFGGPPPASGAPPSSSAREGSKDAPIPIDDGPPPSANALKRKASIDSPTVSSAGSIANGAKKKRKTVDIESFHPDLQEALLELKAAISKESFEQKGKFPPGLKPMLNRVALKAIGCGEYNDNFFSLMPQLFIYNKFTMTKLIKRTVYGDHQALLAQRQDELLGQLKKIADDDYPRAVEEYEKHVSQWEKRQAKAAEGGSVETTPAPPGSASATPNVNNTVPLPSQRGDNGDESGMDVDGAPPSTQGAQGAGGQHNAHSTKPSKRYRLSEPMRNIIWELVVLSNESVRIENEKNTLEQLNAQTVSEQGMRKTLYQKVVQAFPEGWMSSGQISREVSVMKKRYEQQQQEDAS
ncbi:hypothetical protein SCHPADRAFT_927081 [Schizopora paradoxa]|uniref:Ubinuclein middle domain-containing protein n=1 Tax=Schizopora paradoxa TaxID=27342 RepID=A0A0H2RUQ8_9AGAM|nr:hypothetical protein SCHPADRAFT_927081 [Schizopora paradoxa]